MLVVNFWATWCVPCIREIPSFNKLHQEYGPKGVAVIGIGMDEEGAERVRPFLAKHPMQYTVGLGSQDLNQKYKLDALPVTLVFDRTGKQVKRFEGFTPEAAKRVPEAFYTTRNVGLGLGLTVSRKIIEVHHGRLQIEAPKIGHHGLVRISLPLEAQATK